MLCPYHGNRKVNRKENVFLIILKSHMNNIVKKQLVSSHNFNSDNVKQLEIQSITN